MPYITSQNAAITADRNWLISKTVPEPLVAV